MRAASRLASSRSGLIRSTLPQCQELPGFSKLRIAVVGGGLAGLAAGFELMMLGFKVRIFEARKRVGGRSRSYTDLSPNSFVEAGGEFIGKRHEHWLRYAQMFGLKLYEISPDDYSGPFSQVIVDPDEQLICQQDANSILSEFDCLRDTLLRDVQGIATDTPWASPSAKALDQMSMADCIASLPISDAAKRIISLQVEANQGVSAELISYLGFLVSVAAHGAEAFWSDTENFRCAGGTQSLAESFRQQLGGRIRTSSNVVEIAQDERKVQVTLAEGETQDFDHLILAAPCATWSSIRILPKLPEGQVLQTGLSVKFLLAVEKDFPTTWGLNPISIRDNCLLSLIWDATSGQSSDYKVLAGFSGGGAAKRLSSMPEEQVAPACIGELNRLMPGIIKASKGSRFKCWPKSEFTRGGYSCPAPGDVTSKWPFFWNSTGRISFVGEAFSPFWSFMNGGLDSAKRVVTALHRQYA